MQLVACNMQLATKPITSAIKLATLQQNGRAPPARWLSINWNYIFGGWCKHKYKQPNPKKLFYYVFEATIRWM